MAGGRPRLPDRDRHGDGPSTGNRGWAQEPEDHVPSRPQAVAHGIALRMLVGSRSPWPDFARVETYASGALIDTSADWCSRCIHCITSWELHQSGLQHTRNGYLKKGRREAVRYPQTVTWETAMNNATFP